MTIKLTEKQYQWLNNAYDILNEDVFVNGVNGKKANLTYSKRPSTNMTKNHGNMSSFDMLDTGKMDQNNNDTYIVPLKGGLNSYNITSIKGTDVMHYFKNKINKKKTEMKLMVNGVKDDYELIMSDPEWNEFISTFINKVSNIVNYAIGNFNNKKGFNEVSIYPVPSSSGFNAFMCKMIAGNMKISGMDVKSIDNTIFKKDLSNLEKDTDFINKNKAYYSRRMYDNSKNDVTHEEWIDNTLRKLRNTSEAQDETLIKNYNEWINKVLISYRNKVSPQKLAQNYQNLVTAYNNIRQKLQRNRWQNAFSVMKYAKGPSVEKRSQAIWDIVTPILGKTYMSNNMIEIVEIRPKDFQIKNLTNDTRMGMRNYFKAEDDIDDEINSIRNTVFVIFDDNISGGATLSDICYQCKKLGINYLVPITFGEMRSKYSNGTLQISKPTKSGRFENY